MAVTAPEQMIGDNLRAVQDRIADACAKAGRDPQSVRLLAVSKFHPIAAIAAAYEAGQREFGENYVQDLVTKADAMRDMDGIRFRMIGHLQRNKAKDVARVAHALDALDSSRLADALDDKARALGRALDVLIQVNVAAEPQKAGVSVAELPALIAHVRTLPALSLRGLMTIPPAQDDPERSRPWFAKLHELATQHALPELSMGMSGDLEQAILEGSTMVRIGTAIFGERQG